MKYLHPIEPFLLLAGGEGPPCLDQHTDDERQRWALASRDQGLPALIGHPTTPPTAVRGVSDGLWAPVGREGVFLHREDFLFERDLVKTRWSLVLGLDVLRSPFAAATAVPRDVVEAMRGHLCAAGVDPGGITVFYRDEHQFLDKLVEARGDIPPLVSLQGNRGDRHRVWLLSPDEGDALIRFLETCRCTVVGDVALYRAILRLREEPGFPRHPRAIVNFFNQRDFSVTLAGSAIIYPRFDGFDINSFIAYLHANYEINEFHASPLVPAAFAYRELYERMRTEGITQRVAGVIVHGVDTAFLVKVPEDTTPPRIGGEVPEIALDYDVEWVERGIVQPLFPPEAARPMMVVEDAQKLPEALEQHGGGIGIVLNPPPKRHIADLAQMGWRLPYWALQLRPPVARGLFLTPLTPAKKLVL